MPVKRKMPDKIRQLRELLKAEFGAKHVDLHHYGGMWTLYVRGGEIAMGGKLARPAIAKIDITERSP